jgi:hypothetical protein
MTEPLHIEETTVRDLQEILCPHNKHTKLARMAAEFFVQEHSLKVTEKEVAEPRIDTRTLRRFTDFLIKKGYN